MRNIYQSGCIGMRISDMKINYSYDMSGKCCI